MITYSFSDACHERRVTTSLFFNGFGQSPVNKGGGKYFYDTYALKQTQLHYLNTQ